jgi:hypothetical protein
MKIWKNIGRLSLLAVIGTSFLVPAGAAEKPALRQGKDPAIEIVRINPSKGDLRKVKQKRKQLPPGGAQEEQVYVIKLYVDMPPARAGGPLLYIGDTNQEFGSFAEGIFFKAYDQRDLESWRGKPVRFVYGHEIIELGLVFPGKPDEEKPGRLPELHEVLKPK